MFPTPDEWFWALVVSLELAVICALSAGIVYGVPALSRLMERWHRNRLVARRRRTLAKRYVAHREWRAGL